MRAAEQSLLFEQIEIAADGDDGNAKLRAEIIHGDRAVLLQPAQDGVKALLLSILDGFGASFGLAAGFLRLGFIVRQSFPALLNLL
jgi:hypothetical protein